MYTLCTRYMPQYSRYVHMSDGSKRGTICETPMEGRLRNLIRWILVLVNDYCLPHLNPLDVNRNIYQDAMRPILCFCISVGNNHLFKSKNYNALSHNKVTCFFFSSILSQNCRPLTYFEYSDVSTQ